MVKILKKLTKSIRKPTVGDVYGEYTVMLIGYRGTEEVYICESNVTGTIYLKTEAELREEAAWSKANGRKAAI